MHAFNVSRADMEKIKHSSTNTSTLLKSQWASFLPPGSTFVKQETHMENTYLAVQGWSEGKRYHMTEQFWNKSFKKWRNDNILSILPPSSKEFVSFLYLHLGSYSQVKFALTRQICAALWKWTQANTLVLSWNRHGLWSKQFCKLHTCSKAAEVDLLRPLLQTLTQCYWGNSVPSCSPSTEKTDWTKMLAGTGHCCVAHNRSHCWAESQEKPFSRWQRYWGQFHVSPWPTSTLVNSSKNKHLLSQCFSKNGGFFPMNYL